MEKKYFNSVFKIEFQIPVLHMQYVCWGTSIMDGVTLCPMGTERLNIHIYIQFISFTVSLDQIKGYIVSV